MVIRKLSVYRLSSVLVFTTFSRQSAGTEVMKDNGIGLDPICRVLVLLFHFSFVWYLSWFLVTSHGSSF